MQFSRIFAKFVKFSPCKKSAGRQFMKLNPWKKKKKKNPFFKISKTYISTLDSLSINDDQSCENISQDIKQYLSRDNIERKM